MSYREFQPKETGIDKTLVFLTVTAALIPISYILIKRYSLFDKAKDYVEPVLETAQETVSNTVEAIKNDPEVAGAIEALAKNLAEMRNATVLTIKNQAQDAVDSTADKTKEVIDDFTKERKDSIEEFKKENGGLKKDGKS